MIINAQFLILGTGASMGIPVIGCHCPVCTSSSSNNKRTRPSALMKVGSQRILIDCGPDFRNQALSYQIETLDGLLLTHAHQDHIAGLDDLRIFILRSKRPLPCLMSAESLIELKKSFHYIFEDNRPYMDMASRFDLHLLEKDRGEVTFLGVNIKYFSYEQNRMVVYGFRIGNLAYVTDIKHYSESIFEDLNGVEILILSALRFSKSDLHFTVDEAVEFVKKVKPKQTWLTHIAHDLDHNTTNAYLPEGIKLAYDGLQLEFSADILEFFRRKYAV